MTTLPQTKRLTPEEYLASERKSEAKHELIHGERREMGGASRWHNRITINLIQALGGCLSGTTGEVFASDMRVKGTPSGRYTYPDALIVREEPQFEDEELDTLLNPAVIFEVLSGSTEGDDRGEKFEHYRTLDSFTEYVLIRQGRPHAEHYERENDGRWMLSEVSGLEAALTLASVDCELALADIYDGVDLNA